MPSIQNSQESLDAIAQHLHDRAPIWANLDKATRVQYLEQCLIDGMAIAEEWVEAACRAKGIDPNSALAGEEWLLGPVVVLSNIRRLIQALQPSGFPKGRFSFGKASPALRYRGDQAIVDLFPDGVLNRLLWLFYRGEIWLEPGKLPTQGQSYSHPHHSEVMLVLGAGNTSSIAAMDALYQLFVQNNVVLLKLNPVNDYIDLFLEKIFSCLQKDGFLAIVKGEVAIGQYLCQHSLIEAIHMTGSHRTYAAIAQAVPHKPITAELGCVTPVIIVPGKWSRSDLRRQARHIVGMVVNNVSFNCAAAKVLVMARNWPQRQALLDAIQQEFAHNPVRSAYYPGARDRYQAFRDRYPQAIAIGQERGDRLPWMLIPDVPPQAGEYALEHEAFCGVLAETSLDADEPLTFLQQAVAFVNAQVWGNLSCMVFVDPATRRQLGAELETAVANLQYGAVGINVWTAVIYSLSVFTWGAFARNSQKTSPSGQGVVHNTNLLDYPEKSVLWAPFRPFPTPVWVARHGNLRQVGRNFAAYEANPSFGRFLKLAIAALQN